MKKILPALMLFAFLVPNAGCPTSAKQKVEPIVNGVIACAKAEEAVIGKQISVLQVGLDVGQALLTAVLMGASLDSASAAVDGLIAKYKPLLGPDAETLVACAVYAVENGGAQPPAAGSGSGSAVVVAEGSGSGSAGAGSGSAAAAPMSGAMAMALKAAPDTSKKLAADVIGKHGWKFAQ
jgi:hypothetical protein